MSEMTKATIEQLNNDEREIRNLLARMGHMADYGDLDVYLTLFTEDAVWEMQGLFIQDTDTAPRIGRCGHYHDTLKRTPDGWKLAHRRIINEDT